MRVRYITLSAGPDGVIQPGTEQEVPESRGLALIAAGSAVALDAPQSRQSPVQTAVKAPEEKAVTHEPRPAKRTRRPSRKSG